MHVFTDKHVCRYCQQCIIRSVNFPNIERKTESETSDYRAESVNENFPAPANLCDTWSSKGRGYDARRERTNGAGWGGQIVIPQSGTVNNRHPRPMGIIYERRRPHVTILNRVAAKVVTCRLFHLLFARV